MSWNPEYDNFDIDLIDMGDADGTRRAHHMAATLPDGKFAGDMWVDDKTGQLFVFRDEHWSRITFTATATPREGSTE